eukprot:11701422-Prorocentrum_lima.AAC.1
MTSSLVGSEMCIRDRVEVACVARWCEGQGVCPICGVWVFGVPVCGGPVSYTHLTLPTICSV